MFGSRVGERFWERVLFCAAAERPSPTKTALTDLRAEVRLIILNIISQLRNGTRPSLAGKIPDLTPEMEEAFRTGQYRIIRIEDEGKENFQLEHIFGGDTVYYSLPWTEIGMEMDPRPANRRMAFQAYCEWKRNEVGFPQGDLEKARSEFRSEITAKFGIEIKNAATAGEMYLVMEVLRLLPERFLKGEAIKAIWLHGPRTGAARFGSYDQTTGEVKVIDTYGLFDKHLVTAFLVQEIGHAVYASLNARERAGVESLFSRFWHNRAVFGTKILGMSENDRIQNQEDESGFFAENFMHYIILGDNFLASSGSEKHLRLALYNYYFNLIPPVSV